MTVEMLAGDCLEVLPTLAESSVDSCVCDPPYHLTSIVKRFGATGAAPAQYGKDGAYARASSGFMGKQWDGGDIAFRPDVWREVWRVLKPGAHLLAFGGTRTYHRMACAIEDAGFEIRDTIMWVYGSGFPKSHDVSKGMDRAAGVTRNKVVATGSLHKNRLMNDDGWSKIGADIALMDAPEPATDAARRWEGWGTALKPACEPIVLARKPLAEGTVAANVLRWGTGAINVDGTRIFSGTEHMRGAVAGTANGSLASLRGRKDFIATDSPLGRWPANLIHDGSEEVLAGFPDTADSPTGLITQGGDHFSIGSDARTRGTKFQGHGDSGSAARFFYTAKADTDDRLGSKHPTVKPLDLMQYLVRLVTPKGGLVLDPFAGTGTTGEAAFREGCSAVLIEREAEYQADIKRRIAMLLGGPEERAREAIKERMKDKPRDDGPLFA